MSLVLHAHPLSSYCQKVLLGLGENGVAFDYRKIDFGEPVHAAELERLWPMKRIPILVEDGRTIVESSIILEHVDRKYPGRTKLIPDDAAAALEARFMDRVFDCYVMTPMQAVVFEALRPPEARDPFGVAKARKELDTIYAWLDAKLDGREWAAGSAFTLADCAAAPSLFYADWTQPIPAEYARLKAYRARLLARPEFARVVDDARPYRHLYPLGAPDRD